MNEETIKSLNQPLDPALVAHRQGGRGMTLAYIEGYVAINQANRIFGYDEWRYSVTSIDYHERGNARFYSAVVAVNVEDARREDVGFCEVEANRAGEYTGEAHDTAIKGAVTDAMKRALRTFGAQFGNSLYSKEPATASERPATAQQQAPGWLNEGAILDNAAADSTKCPQCGKNKQPSYKLCYTCNQQARAAQ